MGNTFIDPNSKQYYEQNREQLNMYFEQEAGYPSWQKILSYPIEYGPKVFDLIYRGIWNFIWRWYR